MQRYAACIIAAIVIAGSITGLRPATASTYEPPLSIPNATTVKAEHGIPDKPTAEGYWDHDWPPPGEQSNLSAFIVNNQDQSVSFVLVFQISYINNVTQSIEWRADELEAGESKVVSVPWTPDHPGHFEIDIFAVSELEKPAPLSDATLYQTYSRPGDFGQIYDLLPDLTMLTATQNGAQMNQTGILGTFSYLVTADSNILIPKNSTELSSGDAVVFELSDTETWLLKETLLQYYQVGADIARGREFDDYYEPANFPSSFNVLEGDDKKEYAVDLPEGDYVFVVYTTFQYKIGDMLTDTGNGYYFFRVVVD